MNRGRPRLIASLKKAAHLAFIGFFFLVLITPSWRYGPFSWFSLWQFESLAGGPVKLGILNLLPLAVVFFWLVYRLFLWLRGIQPPSVFQWGNKHTTLPLLALSLLGILSLFTAPARLQFIQLGGLLLAWLVYLFVLNERPNLNLVLAAVILVEGGVAIGQFIHQGDLGLSWLGELELDPIYQGVSVIFARERPWLRAYGLTAHPNLLGAILTTLLLLLLPVTIRSGGRRRVAWYCVLLVGLAGLIITFSRGAGLAFVAGLVTWFFLRERPMRVKGSTDSRRQDLLHLIERNLKFILPLLLFIPLLFYYSDLFLSRLTNLDAPSEAQSLNQRLEDAEVAIELIADNPLTGVGLGQYTDVAQSMYPEAARVHNVLLLVTAELGLPGLLLVLWLLLAPLTARPLHAAAIAPWVAMLVIGLFDTTLWLTSNWQTAILFGLLAANLHLDRAKSRST